MKRIMSVLFVFSLLLGLGLVTVGDVYAQSAQQSAGAAVTQTGARGDAATKCDGATSSTQVTLTLSNPGAGLSNYITMIGVFGEASGVPTAATPTMTTMTGVAGATPQLHPLESVYPAAGAQGSIAGRYVNLVTPIKCAAATACAIVGPTAITNVTQAAVACYYAAP
jgi:hypothetical protein